MNWEKSEYAPVHFLRVDGSIEASVKELGQMYQGILWMPGGEIKKLKKEYSLANAKAAVEQAVKTKESKNNVK